MFGFESTMAIRHLRSGGGQTVLTVSAIATGVTVIVFMSSLLFGQRTYLAEMLTDILPRVTVTPPEPDPTPLASIPGAASGTSLSRIERQTQQRKDIENWQGAVDIIQQVPRVRTVVPLVSGQGFVSRGGKQIGAQVSGADPRTLDRVMPLTKYLVSGHYFDLKSGEIFLSYKLSHDLAVNLGDRVWLTSTQNISDSFLVAGIFDTGQEIAAAYITLRAAQSLFATGSAVRSLLVQTDDLFDAAGVAAAIRTRLPYKVEAWSEQFPQFVAYLGVYESLAYLISGFSLVASSFAIASVLIVSVLQKSKQIGILKSIGAKEKQIQRIFLLEGLGISLIGGTAGAMVGALIALGMRVIKQPPTHPGGRIEPLFHTVLSWQLISAAMLAAVIATLLASILPARRAAHLNPVEVMR